MDRDKLKQIRVLDFAINIYRLIRDSFYTIEDWWLIKMAPYRIKKALDRTKRKDKVVVVFFAMNLSMWRYQGIYDLMKNNSRYIPYIILSPPRLYKRIQQELEIQKLREYFTTLNIEYIDYDFNSEPIDIKKRLCPDILFYPQPYRNVLIPKHDSLNFINSLLCYCPYAFWTSKYNWGYNTLFHNIAWKLFYSTEIHRNIACQIARNNGRNVEVVGYPNADGFLKGKYVDVWKKQEHTKKRIIWAPHCTINTGKNPEGQSNFLVMADLMLELVDKYQNEVQFVFKPHPRLKTELYNNRTWGIEKTDAYYEQWKNRSNCQLEEGLFIDLFMTSDAMIHDSGSFSVEYHYTQKPVMFISEDLSKFCSALCEFGNKAMDMHYFGFGRDDIERFIEDVVIRGNDTMRDERKSFYNEYLLPPNNRTVAENILQVIDAALSK